jgi:hypothetical protein
MQNGKENFKVTLKSIKEKAHDWEYRHLWTARFIEYFFFFCLVLFATLYGFAHLNLIHTEPVSALYMLSALVQSQAAIVAIVVSLTLIAVQLTASAYTPRVIRIFLKTPDMWYLLGFYGFSIFLGLLFLKMIRVGEDLSQIVIFYSSLEYSIIFIYALGISSFALLFLYFGNTINLLNPANIIHRLQIGITKDNLLNTEDDPIQPVMDIVHGSIMKYDIATTRIGLKAVTNRMIEIIEPDNQKEISDRFCEHLQRVSKLTISREDPESTEKVIENFEKFGKSATEKELTGAASTAVEFIEGVGVTAMKMDFAVSGQALDSLEAIGNVAANKELENLAWHVARYLRNFGLSAAEEGYEGVTKITAWHLKDIGIVFVEKGLQKAAGQAAESLVDLGVKCCRKKLGIAASQMAKSLAELTTSNEEIVKTAIHDYESKLREQDRDSFQKFIKIYEQELEKLRAEKSTPNKKTESS